MATDQLPDLTTDVVIAGGGPVGCTLAIALANLGLRTVVVEKSSGPHPLPRAILMDAEIHRALIHQGLAAMLSPLLTPMRSAEYVDRDGRRLAGAEFGDERVLGGLPRSSVHFQPELEAMLQSEMVRRGTVVLDRTEFVGIVDDESGIGVVTADGRTVRGRWLAACDGASSLIRRELGIGLEDLGFDQDWMVVDVALRDRATAGLPDAARQICDPERPATLISGHRSMYRWELQLQPGEDPQAMSEPDSVWRLLAPWITLDQAELVRAASYRFHAVVAQTMRRGRAFLVGDAAHQMPPFMGQGLNSGMRDAFNLAWKLAWVARGWGDDRLLDTYSSERLEHSRATVETSVAAGRLIDQLAGRQSHGIEPSSRYGGDGPRPKYGHGVVTGEHPRVGTVYRSWHAVVRSIPTPPEMLVLTRSSVPAPGLPAVGWSHRHVDDSATYGADHVVVRPDGYIAAICDAVSIDHVIDDLASRIRG